MRQAPHTQPTSWRCCSQRPLRGKPDPLSAGAAPDFATASNRSQNTARALPKTLRPAAKNLVEQSDLKRARKWRWPAMRPRSRPSAVKKARRRGDECVELVRQASDLQVRASLVIMSQRWLEQAELAERDALERSSRHRPIQAAIGEKLRTLYRPLNYLPPHFLALLSQLDGIRRRGSRGTKRAGSRPASPDCRG
jgi:hypothetical protein